MILITSEKCVFILSLWPQAKEKDPLIFSKMLFYEYTGGYNTNLILFSSLSVVCFAKCLCKPFV